MKIAVIFPLLALGGATCGAATPAQCGRNVSDFLYAIRQVESGDRPDGPAGKAGELGAYQFRETVWRQHTDAPFAQARTPLADLVAQRHYEWLARALRSGGVVPSPWSLAAAWNCGVDSVCVGRIPVAAKDYAARVRNLVESVSREGHPAAYPLRVAAAGRN